MSERKLALVERKPNASYSEALAETICEVIATTPKGLDHLCKTHDGWPTVQGLEAWLRRYPEFCRAYEQAKERQAEMLAYEILEIGDDSSGDTKVIVNNAGKEVAVMDREYVQRSALRCENRRWIAARLAPKRFGDKLDLNASIGPRRVEDFLDQLD